jgi:hypothetical protein
MKSLGFKPDIGFCLSVVPLCGIAETEEMIARRFFLFAASSPMLRDVQSSRSTGCQSVSTINDDFTP